MKITRIEVRTGVVPGKITLSAVEDEEEEENWDTFAYYGFTAHLDLDDADWLLRVLTDSAEDLLETIPADCTVHTAAGYDFPTGGFYVNSRFVDACVYDRECDHDEDDPECRDAKFYDKPLCAQGQAVESFDEDVDLGARPIWDALVLPLTLALGALAYDVALSTAA